MAARGPKQLDRRSPSQKLRQARRASLIKYAPSSLGHTLLEEAMSGGKVGPHRRMQGAAPIRVELGHRNYKERPLTDYCPLVSVLLSGSPYTERQARVSRTVAPTTP
uniref:Uncharacterized protein n=1 Tax=Human herpesvirus 1 TaxID=10298 RepID=A0A2Z4H567_HHV1|nr:hypothetical protein [Human alphaherpesvirus 1]